MNKKIAMIIAAVVVFGGGGIVILNKKTDNTSKTSDAQSSPATTNTPVQAKQAAATITYSNSGFSPSTTTVKSGDLVSISNTSSTSLQLDSDPHPAHTDNSDLNVGTIKPGQSKTFTVTKTGTFGFHNHLNSNNTGSITIN